MPFKSRFRLSKSFLITAFAAMPLSFVLGQQATQPAVPRGGLNPDSFYGKDTFGVSVRDSLEAVKKIEDARRMERLQDWNKAADWYQEVIEKYGQYVVPSGTDEQNNIRQYTGIERPVQEQLAKWPKVGLDAYRNRYGAVAGTMLEQSRADDRETLSRVMKLYFVTEAGKAAGIRLLDLLLEGGEFAEAARVGDRLLDWHPTLVVERPKVLFRTALAYHLSGDEKKATERSDQLKTKHAGAVGTLFGKDIVLADALAKLMQVTPPVSIATSTNAMRMNPGGDETRSMISAAMARPGARMATVDYVPLMPMGNNNMAMRRGMMIQDDGSGNNNIGDQTAGFGVLPVADNGELFFQDGSRVYAVSLQSGVPLPGWLQTYPNSNGQYSVQSFGNARVEQHTLTLTDNSVLGVMGYSDRLSIYGVPRLGKDPGTRLVCLDRATGKEKWVSKPSKIAEENLRAVDFSGSPLVVADNVYVIGRGGKNPTSEDCYVLCFDVNTGNYKWSCFIASSTNGYNQFNGQFSSNDSLSHLAYSSGRIYVLTNLGATAAIDAYSGTISWLNIYPRDVEMMNPNMGWRVMNQTRGNNGAKPWEFNPVIVQDGMVFVLPSDSKFIMVYEAGSGIERKRISIADFQKRPDDSVGPQALVAVDGNQMFLTGGACVYCIDWTWTRPKAPVKPDDRTDPILWFSIFGTNIKGRAFVTWDSVFVCIDSGVIAGKPVDGGLRRLERFNPKTKAISGRVKESYPDHKDWDEGEGPGNIIVVGDHIVVASNKRLNVYADFNLACKRLDDDVAAAPTDPEIRLRYAEVMFVANHMDKAMGKINETVTLLGGLKALRPGPGRDHLFSDCLTFAAKLQKDVKNLSSEQMQAAIDAVTPLYDLAAAAADSPIQQVNYRMSRAKFNRYFVEENSLPAAVELYQEILSAAGLRTVPLPDETQGMLQASEVAEKLIAEVKKLKPQAYEKFEKQAAEALQAAANDPALLKSVAETYPNSTSAPQAMTKAAAAFEAQGNIDGYRLAALALRQTATKYGDTADKPKILEAMARVYLAMPETSVSDRAGTANARLSSIIKLGFGNNKLSKALKLPDNKVLAEEGTTVTDAWKAIRSYKAQAVRGKVPDFHIPGKATDKQKADFAGALAAWKAAGALPDKRPEMNPAFDPDPATHVVLANITGIIKPQLDLRLQTSRYDRLVAWSNGNVQIYPVGAKEPVGSSAELTSDPKNLAWIDPSTLLVWGDSEIVLLDGANGAKKWPNKLTLKQLPRVDVVAGGAVDENVAGGADDNVNGQFINGGRRVVIRGAVNARLIGGMAVPVQAAGPAAPAAETIVSVRPVDDKIIVATSAGQLFALNTADGHLAWQTRLSNTGAIVRVAATDDFTVARVDDQTGSQLVIVNTYDGQLVKRMNFSIESNTILVNFALAPDGTLVWIQPDRLCGKDLFEAKTEPNYSIVAGQSDARGPNVNIQVNGQGSVPIYAGAANPDQLVISEGRILVVNNNGRYVSIHSLDTGQLSTFSQGDGRKPEARLSTVNENEPSHVFDWGVGLHVLGSRLYVATRMSGPIAYDLDTGHLWNGSFTKETGSISLNFQEPYIGQDHLVLLERRAVKPGPPAGNTSIIRLHCYGLRESGLVNHFPFIRDESGITEVQGMEGGFYYLTGDKKLHFLKGARP